MTARGQVGRVAQNAVGAPGHEMRGARHDVLAAAGAEVRLRSLRLGDRLHVPLSAAAHLGASPARGEPFDIEFGMLLASTSRPAPGSVRTRHGIQSRLRAGAWLPAEPRRDQYQPTSCEWAHAPQGVPYRPET